MGGKPRKNPLTLEEVRSVCQNCREPKPSTYRRTIYAHHYTGPCGDSFCYAGCRMTSCRPTSVTVCDECVASVGKEN